MPNPDQKPYILNILSRNAMSMTSGNALNITLCYNILMSKSIYKSVKHQLFLSKVIIKQINSSRTTVLVNI